MLSRIANNIKATAATVTHQIQSQIHSHSLSPSSSSPSPSSSSSLSSSLPSLPLLSHDPIPCGPHTVRLISCLGEGGYSFVYSCVDIHSGEKFAMKKMTVHDEENGQLAEKEIAIMKKLIGKPHTVQFVSACKRTVSNGAIEYFMLMEVASGGSLIDIIRELKPYEYLSEMFICEIFSQCCDSVYHLHSMETPVAHRDIKLENFLIKYNNTQNTHITLQQYVSQFIHSTTSSSSSPSPLPPSNLFPIDVILCDFGSCTTRNQIYSTREEMAVEEDRISRYSTSMYRAPEMCDLYKKERVGEKVDIWALSCILFALSFHTHPYQESGPLAILSAQYFIPDEYPHPYSSYLISLIKRLFTISVAKRPSIVDVIGMVQKWREDLKAGKAVPVNKGKAVTSPSSSSSSSSSSVSSVDDAFAEFKASSTKKTKTKKTKSPTSAAETNNENKSSTAGSAAFDDFAADFAADWNPFPTTTTSNGNGNNNQNQNNKSNGFSASSSSSSASSSSSSFSNDFGFSSTPNPSKTANLFDFPSNINVPPPSHPHRAESSPPNFSSLPSPPPSTLHHSSSEKFAPISVNLSSFKTAIKNDKKSSLSSSSSSAQKKSPAVGKSVKVSPYKEESSEEEESEEEDD